jgi:hypothetical protein
MPFFMKHNGVVYFMFGFFLFYASACFAQRTEPNNILGYAWGTDYKTCVLDLKRYGIKYKSEKNKEISFQKEDANIKLIFRGGLRQIIKSWSFPLHEGKKALAKMNENLAELVENYGSYHTSQSQENEVMVFGWKFTKTELTLIYYLPSNVVTIEYSLS